MCAILHEFFGCKTEVFEYQFCLPIHLTSFTSENGTDSAFVFLNSLYLNITYSTNKFKIFKLHYKFATALSYSEVHNSSRTKIRDMQHSKNSVLAKMLDEQLVTKTKYFLSLSLFSMIIFKI